MVQPKYTLWKCVKLKDGSWRYKAELIALKPTEHLEMIAATGAEISLIMLIMSRLRSLIDR